MLFRSRAFVSRTSRPLRSAMVPRNTPALCVRTMHVFPIIVTSPRWLITVKRTGLNTRPVPRAANPFQCGGSFRAARPRHPLRSWANPITFIGLSVRIWRTAAVIYYCQFVPGRAGLRMGGYCLKSVYCLQIIPTNSMLL